MMSLPAHKVLCIHHPSPSTLLLGVLKLSCTVMASPQCNVPHTSLSHLSTSLHVSPPHHLTTCTSTSSLPPPHHLTTCTSTSSPHYMYLHLITSLHVPPPQHLTTCPSTSSPHYMSLHLITSSPHYMYLHLITSSPHYLITPSAGAQTFSCDASLSKPLCPGTIAKCTCTVIGVNSFMRWNFSNGTVCDNNFIQLTQPPLCNILNATCGPYLSAASTNVGVGQCNTSILTISAHISLDGLVITCLDITSLDISYGYLWRMVGNSMMSVAG